jgi:hypothetical protein
MPVVLNACEPSEYISIRQTRIVGIPVSIKRVRMESEPSRQRFTPSRSIYMVGWYSSGGEWRKMSQPTRSPICFVVLIISVLMSLILMANNAPRASWGQLLPDKTVAVIGRRSGYQGFNLYRLIALGKTQNSFEWKEGFGFAHRQLPTVEETPKAGRERKWPILAVAHRAKFGYILLRLQE